jgi:hypothetical protein
MGLIETLGRHALIFERDRTAEFFRKFAQSEQAYRRRAAGRTQRRQPALPDGPGIPSVPRRWSPTPFGEQVLRYYREAAAADTEDER